MEYNELTNPLIKGESYVTREGRRIRIIDIDSYCERPVVGRYDDGTIWTYYFNGRRTDNGTPLDIIGPWEPPKRRPLNYGELCKLIGRTIQQQATSIGTYSVPITAMVTGVEVLDGEIRIHAGSLRIRAVELMDHWVLLAHDIDSPCEPLHDEFPQKLPDKNSE